MSWYTVLLTSGGGLTAVGLARQMRLYLVERGEQKLRRREIDLTQHMFDQTRSTKELASYTALVSSRRR